MEGVLGALANLYEKPSPSDKVFLMKHLFNMNMSKGGFVADHLNEFNTVTDKLSYVGVNFDDKVLLLQPLPQKKFMF